MEIGQELFRSYLDESEDSGTRIYVVGGFVGKQTVWSELEPKWLQSLPPGISSFHATDCFTGNRAFKQIDIPQRVALLDKLTEVIVAHEVFLVGYGIDAKTYEKVAPKAKQNEFLKNKYAAPFGGVVELACHVMGNLPGPLEVFEVLRQGENWEQCAFFIESNEYSASAHQVIEDLRKSRDLWWVHRIGSDNYGSKSGASGIPLLQVADLGAFLAAKHISKAPEGKISWKTYYDKLTSGRVHSMRIADENSLLKLHKLHQDLQREAKEGRHYLDDF